MLKTTSNGVIACCHRVRYCCKQHRYSLSTEHEEEVFQWKEILHLYISFLFNILSTRHIRASLPLAQSPGCDRMFWAPWREAQLKMCIL